MSDLYTEILANLTWYQLNSYYKDPMYQYMLNYQKEYYNKYIRPLPLANYTVQDDFVIYAKNDVPRYGNYQCSTITGKEVYMDSAFSCFLFQLPFFLEKLQFGYIGFVFVLPILLISTFGGIKENYKWFILNQGIWDAFLCYDYICATPTLLGWSSPSIYGNQNTCFYRTQSNTNNFVYIVLQGFRVFLRNASFIPVFHLAFSRFLCMYFPGFYKKFTKNGYRIFIFLIFFNGICISIFSGANFSVAVSVISASKDGEKCETFCPMKNITYCIQNIPEYFRCQNQLNLNISILLNDAKVEQQKISMVFKQISYSIPPIMFFLSIICAGFLLYKITSQLQFQLKTNPDSFKQTMKISSVVGFQCATMSVIFLITSLQKFMQIKSAAIGKYYIYDDLPTWLLLLQMYTTTASLNMIRIIVDSCIILTVLSGYSKCVVLMLKFSFHCFTHPTKAFKHFKQSMKGSSQITVVFTLSK